MMKKVSLLLCFLLMVAACSYAASGPQNFPQGEIRLGVNDATRGTVTVYGDNNTSGALVTLFNAANEDTSAQAYRIMADNNNLTFGSINATTGAYSYIMQLIYGGGLAMNGGTLDTNGGSIDTDGGGIATDGGTIAVSGGDITGVDTADIGTISSAVLIGANQLTVGAAGPVAGDSVAIYKPLGSGNAFYVQGASSTKMWIDRFTSMVTSGTLRTNQSITSGDDLIAADDATIGDDATVGGDLDVDGSATIGTVTINGDITAPGGEVVAASGDFTSAEVDTLNLPTAPSGQLMLSGAPITYVDATGATDGQVPTMQGDGSIEWETPSGGGGGGGGWDGGDLITTGSLRAEGDIHTSGTLVKNLDGGGYIGFFNDEEVLTYGTIGVSFEGGPLKYPLKFNGEENILYLNDDWAFNSSAGMSITSNTIGATFGSFSDLTGGTIDTGQGDFEIQNAAADGSTKGLASFAASDFNSSSGNITIDYTNGQAASGSNKGLLTSTDWTTFNGKYGSGSSPTFGYITATQLTATITGNADNPVISGTSSDAGAVGAYLDLASTSASPAASDVPAAIRFWGRDSGAGNEIYGSISSTIRSPTNSAEVGSMDFVIKNSGFSSSGAFNFDPGSLGRFNITNGDLYLGGTQRIAASGTGNFTQVNISGTSVIDSSRNITAISETLEKASSGSTPISIVRTGTAEGDADRRVFQFKGAVSASATTTIGTLTLPGTTASANEWAWKVRVDVVAYDDFADGGVWYEKSAGYRGTATNLTEVYETALVNQESNAGSDFVITPVASSKNLNLIFTNGGTGSMNVTATVTVDTVGD